MNSRQVAEGGEGGEETAEGLESDDSVAKEKVEEKPRSPVSSSYKNIWKLNSTTAAMRRKSTVAVCVKGLFFPYQDISGAYLLFPCDMQQGFLETDSQKNKTQVFFIFFFTCTKDKCTLGSKGADCSPKHCSSSYCILLFSIFANWQTS